MANVLLGKYVLMWSDRYEDPTPADLARIRDYLEDDNRRLLALPSGCKLVPLDAGDKAAARLAWLLGLSPGERAFVTALADRPHDKVTAAVFADWLAEQDRQKEADAMREAAKPSEQQDTLAGYPVFVSTGLRHRVTHADVERLHVRAGSFEADLDIAGQGVLKLDGVAVPMCQSFTLEVTIGDVPRLTLRTLAMSQQKQG